MGMLITIIDWKTREFKNFDQSYNGRYNDYILNNSTIQRVESQNYSWEIKILIFQKLKDTKFSKLN